MIIKKFRITLGIGLLLFVFACKSAKVNGEKVLNKKITTKQVVKNSAKSTSKFKTLSGRVKIELLEENKSQSYSLSMRMEKDKTIWMSKLGIVKAMITPNRVAFYNKLDNTYFDGDFAYLSDLLGTELDFYKVQRLLLGEPLFELNENDYKASVYEKSYLLAPKKQRELFELFLLFNPSHFKMDSQQITQDKEARHLEINYETYQNVEDQVLPEKIKVHALELGESLIINLEIKNIELNKKMNFPFKIPSGFEAIKF